MKNQGMLKGTPFLPLGLLLAGLLVLGWLALGLHEPGRSQTDGSDAVFLR